MRDYSKFDAVTGRIICSGSCQVEIFDITENILEGQIDETKYFVRLPERVIEAFPEKPSEYHKWDWQTCIWSLSGEDIEKAKTEKSNELNLKCKAVITSGFYSSALGIEYFYPSKETDQANLNASVTSSFYPNLPEDWTTPFWCSIDNDWQYVEHTASQIQQAGLDGKTAILGHLSKNQTLQNQLQQAETLEEIEAIQW